MRGGGGGGEEYERNKLFLLFTPTFVKLTPCIVDEPKGPSTMGVKYICIYYFSYTT